MNVFTTFAALIVGLGFIGPALAERQPPVKWLEPCEVRGLSDPAWCGTYVVYENRAANSGRKIGIYVEVVPALSETPRPDALFYFMGGPGGPATIATGGLASDMTEVHRDRDMVFVDQRGTGRSSPLACAGPAPDGPQACAIWPKGDIDATYQQPVEVDTPTLMITGVYDTATPYEQGDQVARHLPNGRHLVVPNQSHGVANPECQGDIVQEFIAKGSADDLDVACLAETKRPAFALR